VLVVTTDILPGYEIRTVFGEVLGVSARPRNKFVAGVKHLDGSSNPYMTQALAKARHDAVGLMREAAEKRGANAIVGMRFDHRDITDGWGEICAYGTAVFVTVQEMVMALAAEEDHPRGRHAA
jgi:uncharacterized protein YbjQ (UPF0145 family)